LVHVHHDCKYTRIRVEVKLGASVKPTMAPEAAELVALNFATNCSVDGDKKASNPCAFNRWLQI
jgi:hypothetical protein